MLLKDKGALFIHIPKCAGVSIENFFGWKGLRHETLQPYANENPIELLESCFKFVFVRNPWDRMVSWYFKHSGELYEPKTKEGFLSWVKQGMPNHWKVVDKTDWRERNWDGSNDALSSLDFLENDKNIEIDFIGKVETIDEDMKTICEKLNINYNKLSHTNKSNRNHYREYYDEDAKKIVEERLERDLLFFPYEF